MPRDWESQFREWSRPPGQTEAERCSNAETAIRNAIKASDKLKSRGISVFTQGSYRNSTNVRKDSDVDIGIVCADSLFVYEPEGTTDETFGLSPGSYNYKQFKDEVGEALVSYFGSSAITRGNKAFDVHETSYHVEADVAPFFEYRHYSQNGSYLEGVALIPDNGFMRVINWPEQHYANGVQKNSDTGTRFKSIVRVLKALSNEMSANNTSGGNIPGFLIECLAWNVPNNKFQHSSYTDDVSAALVYLYENTKTDELCHKWGEVNEIKYLFRSSQKWTREQANDFTVAAWNYVGLGD